MALGNIKLRSTGSAVTTLSNSVTANISGSITLKNAPLTHSEVDLNFLEIAEDVAALQNATTTFAQLTDTPANFSGAGGKYLRINSGATAVEFDALTTDDVTEGARLYYTDARADTRADARIAAANYGFDQLAAGGTYAINLTSGSLQTSINAGTTSTVGGITLFGRGYTGYGEIAGENLVRLLENQANTTAPSGPLEGQLWYDSGNSVLKVYDSATWQTLALTSQIANSSNWDTAYGWGNHASAGYLTDVVLDTTPQLGASLDANGFDIDMGTNVITDTKVGNWDTSYGWGNHASAGYLTAISGQSINALSDVAITGPSNGHILKYSGGQWVNEFATLNREDDFDVKTISFTAEESRKYGIDTTSGQITVTLPAVPTTGRAIKFAQAGGDFSTNNFVINPNGKNINGSSGNYTHSTNLDFASLGVFYNGTEWRKYS